MRTCVIKCDFCGLIKKGFKGHYEEHISPPRKVNICRACHTKLKGHHVHSTQVTLPLGTELAFTAQVQKLCRIAMTRTICKALDIKPGDYVEVRVKKLSIKPKGYPLTR